jgi:transcriptional regulator
MYIPKHFSEPNLEFMHDLIRANPLATLVTTTTDGLNANHIPLILVENESFGILQGHVARANPIWQESLSEIESLAVFHGSNAYISPSFYATKQENGKVVPTWNYAVVHAYGTLRRCEMVAVTN